MRNFQETWEHCILLWKCIKALENVVMQQHYLSKKKQSNATNQSDNYQIIYLNQDFQDYVLYYSSGTLLLSKSLLTGMEKKCSSRRRCKAGRAPQVVASYTLPSQSFLAALPALYLAKTLLIQCSLWNRQKFNLVSNCWQNFNCFPKLVQPKPDFNYGGFAINAIFPYKLSCK